MRTARSVLNTPNTRQVAAAADRVCCELSLSGTMDIHIVSTHHMPETMMRQSCRAVFFERKVAMDCMDLCEGPVVGDSDIGQPLLQHQCTTGPLHDVDKVDVSITHLPHLHAMPNTLCDTRYTHSAAKPHYKFRWYCASRSAGQESVLYRRQGGMRTVQASLLSLGPTRSPRSGRSAK